MPEFESLRIEGVHWTLRPGAKRAEVEPLLRSALAAVSAGEAPDRKSGRRKQLFELRLAGSESPDHLLKRNGYPPVRGLLAWRSKARRELEIAVGLAERGVPVWQPLAAGERRSSGRLVESLLLIALADGATDLRQHLGTQLASARRRALAVALGQLARTAHAAGLDQDDFAPNNVLVHPGPEELPRLSLIDFERAELRGELSHAERRWMLAKLDRDTRGASASQRMRFLLAYAGDRSEARRWWRELQDFAPQLAARDFSRMCRTSTRDGRRFRHVSGPGWRGYARHGVDATALAASGHGRPGVEASDGVWRIRYARSEGRRARELWAVANLLFARGLGPHPLALLVRSNDVLLVSSRDRAERSEAGRPDHRRALDRLRVRLASLGEWVAESVDSPGTVYEIVGDEAPRARLVTPHSCRFGGR